MSSQASVALIDPKNYKFLQEHVYSHAGLVLEEDKHYLFESRLSPIVRRLGLDSIDDLCALIQSSRQPEVGHQVAEAMTTKSREVLPIERVQRDKLKWRARSHS